MKKITNTLLLIAVIAIGISSCGKDDNGTKTGTDAADKYVGNWRANDTTDYPDEDLYTEVYSFSIEKVDANKVRIINFGTNLSDDDTSFANVTDNSIVLTTGSMSYSITVISSSKFRYDAGPYYYGIAVKL